MGKVDEEFWLMAVSRWLRSRRASPRRGLPARRRAASRTRRARRARCCVAQAPVTTTTPALTPLAAGSGAARCRGAPRRAAAAAPAAPIAEQGRHRLDADVHRARAADDDPGLALFYGGLVRKKNMLSMLMQVFVDLLR